MYTTGTPSPVLLRRPFFDAILSRVRTVMPSRRRPVAYADAPEKLGGQSREPSVATITESRTRTDSVASTRYEVEESRTGVVNTGLASSTGAARQESVLDSPATLIAALLVFSAIAFDVASPISPHLLQPLDQGVHDWVVSNIPYDVRAGVMDNAVSNTAVLVSYVGITSCLTLGALFDVREALRKATLMYAAFAQAGGLIWLDDPMLTKAVKSFFHRARPSDLHKPYNFTVPARRSFSFPSGHSTAAWVLVGAFLFFALPFALEQARDRNDRANAQDAGADARRTDTGKGGASEGPLAEVSRSFGALQDAVAARVVAVSEGLTEQRLLVLWASLAGLTMVGRILSDSHWTTDTLAGAAFGSSLVMLLRKADFAVASVVSLFRRK